MDIVYIAVYMQPVAVSFLVIGLKSMIHLFALSADDHDVGIIFQGDRPRLLVNVCTQYAENPRDLIGTVAKMAYEEAVGKLP